MQETAQHNPPSNAPDLSDFGVKIWQPTPKAIERLKEKRYFSFGANPYLAFERNSYNLSDDLGWVHGNHNFTFGGRIELSKIDNGGPTKLRGCSPSIRTLAVAWQAFCSVLCRPSFRAQVRAPLCATRSPEFMRRIPGGSIGACPINYGVRYKPYLPWTERDGRIEVFSPQAYVARTTSSVYTNAPKGLLFPGDPGVAPQATAPSTLILSRGSNSPWMYSATGGAVAPFLIFWIYAEWGWKPPSILPGRARHCMAFSVAPVLSPARAPSVDRS